MPYIGQRPATGEANSFKILDEISSFTMTFDGSSAAVVSVANDTITAREHRFVTGQRVTYNDGGGTAITGLSDGVYYIIVEDRHTFKLASSANNAASGTAINLTGVGVGAAHTINVAFDGVNTKFKATVDNGTKAGITRSGSLMLSINGVLQEPHDNTTSPTTGYATDHTSTIIFSAAPAATDQFFGRLIASNFATFDITDNVVDNFTGDGSTSTFTLTKSPANNESILVTIDGVVQYPDDNDAVRAYSVSENILDFASAPGSAVEIQVRHIGFAGASSDGITGFYGRTGNAVLKSTDDIVFNDATASGTVEAANVTVTGNLTVNGTTTTLDTELTSVDKLEVAANNTTVAAAITQTGSGDILNLYDGATEVFTVTDGGRVGIGTFDVDSAVKLQVNAAILMAGNGQGDGQTGIEIGHGSPGVGTAHHRIRTGGGAGQNLIIEGQTAASGGDVIFKTGGTNNRLRVTSAGKVGVGINSPIAKLHLVEATEGESVIQLNSGDSYPTVNRGLKIKSATGPTGFAGSKWIFDALSSGGRIQLQTVSTQRLTILETGKVGINTETPLSDLQVITPGQKEDGTFRVGGSAAGLGLLIDYDQNGNTISKITSNPTYTNSNSLFKICVDGDLNPDQLVLKGDGNVGVGEDSPRSLLHLSKGTGTTSSYNTGTLLRLNGTNGANTLTGIGFGYNTTSNDNILSSAFIGVKVSSWTAYVKHDLVFATRGADTNTEPTERLRIDANGKIGVGAVPAAWHSAVSSNVIQVGSSVLFDFSSAQFDVGHNYYYDGTNYKFTNTGYAARMTFSKSDGSIRFWSLGTGSAGANATVTDILRIHADGDLEYTYNDADTAAQVGAAQVHHGLRIYNTNNTLGRLAGISFSHGGAGTANAGIFHETTNTASSSTACLGDLTFWTKNNGVSYMTEKVRISSGGDMGIGDNNPNIRLTVVDSGTENLVRLGRSDGNSHGSHTVNVKASKDFYHNFKMEASSYQLHTYNGSAMSEKLRIDSAGRLGLNLTSINATRMMEIKQPASYTSALRIHTAGSAGNPGYVEWFTGISNWKLGVDNNNDSLIVRRDGTKLVRIDSAGSVHIENDIGKFTTGTSADLQMYHDGSNSYINDSGTGGLYIRGGGQIGFRDSENSFANMANFNSAGSIDLYYNGTKKFETHGSGIKVAGRVFLGGSTNGGFDYNSTADTLEFLTTNGGTHSELTSTAYVPNTNAGKTLGYHNKRWDTLYVNKVAFGGSTNTDQHSLDDYEEGSWTPTVTGGSYSIARAYYIKVGRKVSIFINVGLSSPTGATFTVSLPFAAITSGYTGSSQGVEAHGSCMLYNAAMVSSTYNVCVYCWNGTASLYASRTSLAWRALPGNEVGSSIQFTAHYVSVS